ncbi:TRAP transporter small permease [Pseudosulfitobacter sp. DSM 107133]|uniref:TRAP transporter small permease n=1 Tax=Pseudosulfitobacter sp. DSM 107133 TaxID=2883100 RepID=UPI000DF12997|nr:TRAP transporter small permease [Pseudosulfitobacter sp. DSM 107133]UOA26941.1 C4-dicarboxylate TRAP transporter small permease protein DctQ [Pseudosulfitobacter sp. DSM 107133]
MIGKYKPKGPVGQFVNSLEETVIAALLGVMTMLTFFNVILRYVFNSSLIWSQEVVLVLFAWLVLFGVSYAFKVTAHLGVDAITSLLTPGRRKVVGLISGGICIAYAVLLCKGAWDQWAPFADLPPTTGSWLPTGFDTQARGRSFFETDQIPMPEWLRFLEDWINYGERYSKMPRMIPYLILPISAALILFRVCQATLRIWNNQSESLIVSHEAEDAVEEVAAMNRGE